MNAVLGEDAPAGRQAGVMTLKYREWGGSVDLTAPPAGQVGDLHLG